MIHKPIFFTSDWHVGHANVIKFDNRPFGSLQEMHETLVKRYNATVPHNGVCYFLGDIGNNLNEVRPVVSKLNGTKVLVLGNHDKGMVAMYNCHFDVVVWSASIFIGETKVTMSHCPLPGIFREDTSYTKKSPVENWYGESLSRHRMSTVPDEGQFHLHGHIHSNPEKKDKSKRILDRQFDVGVAANKYTPVSISEIESWITYYKQGKYRHD